MLPYDGHSCDDFSASKGGPSDPENIMRNSSLPRINAMFLFRQVDFAVQTGTPSKGFSVFVRGWLKEGGDETARAQARHNLR